jgi:hypothetical protein
MSNIPPAPLPPDKAQVTNLLNTGIDGLRALDASLAIEIQTLNNVLPPVPPDHQAKLHATIAFSQEVSTAIIRYSLLDSIALNDSHAVQVQIAAMRATNAALKQSLDQVNKIVGTIEGVAAALGVVDQALATLIKLLAIA